MSGRTTAERLLLVTVVDRWFQLCEPVFVDAGQSYWVDRKTDELCVDRGDGRVTRHAGWVCR
ncbi:hypothetical protein [Micromonospora echinaurantiaca]|uniref:hypothetical protein n=1 Tax=Micromonospora echinaurantiaca TaxID=47857 RepID=UPI00344A5927